MAQCLTNTLSARQKTNDLPTYSPSRRPSSITENRVGYGSGQSSIVGMGALDGVSVHRPSKPTRRHGFSCAARLEKAWSLTTSAVAVIVSILITLSQSLRKRISGEVSEPREPASGNSQRPIVQRATNTPLRTHIPLPVARCVIAALVAGLAVSPLSAQPALPAAVPMPTPEIQYLDSAGRPLAGSKLCTYAAGTSTPLATYTNSTGTANTNPVILDTAGRASVWVGPQMYKFVLRTGGTPTGCNDGAIVWTQDNVSDFTLYFANFVKTAGTSVLITYTAPYTGAVTRTVSSKLSDIISVLDFGSIGGGTTADDLLALCVTALPTTGGTCDATALTGAQQITATIAVAKPVRFLFGAANFTTTATPAFSFTSGAEGSSIVGWGRGMSIFTKGVNGVMINIDAGPVDLDNIELEGDGTNFTGGAVHLISGNSQRWTRLYVNNIASNALQIEADQGTFLYIGASLVQTTAGASNAIQIVGTDSTPGHRHFDGVDTGGSLIDIQGAETTMITNTTARNVTMTTASKKLIMTGSRLTTIGNPLEVTGLDHVIVGNAIAGRISLIAGSIDTMAIGNITTSQTTDVSGSRYNTIVDVWGGSRFQQFGVGATPAPANTGLFVRPQVLVGVSQYGMQVAPIGLADATEIAGIFTRADTDADVFTANNLYGMFVQRPVKGAGSTITNNYGIYLEDRDEGTNNYQIYAAGNRPSVFEGSLKTSKAAHIGATGGYGDCGSAFTEINAGAGGSGLSTASSCFGDGSGYGLKIGTNVTGTFASRWTLDDRGVMTFAPISFATLGAMPTTQGSFGFCNDCTKANPCAGAGTGAFFKREGAAWNCN